MLEFKPIDVDISCELSVDVFKVSVESNEVVSWLVNVDVSWNPHAF